MSDELKSPFDEMGEDQITAHVVDQSGGEPRLQGYEIGSDLARHYSFTETIFLALTGEFPTNEQLRLFEVALIGATNIGLADAAVHGSRLARHLAHGSRKPLNVLPTAAFGTAEMTRAQLDELRELFEWLERPAETFPESARGEDEFARALRTAAGDPLPLRSFFDEAPGSIAVVIALLHASGLKTPERVAAAIGMARLPVAIAEAFAVPDPAVWKYPLNIPFWDFQPERPDE